MVQAWAGVEVVTFSDDTDFAAFDIDADHGVIDLLAGLPIVLHIGLLIGMRSDGMHLADSDQPVSVSIIDEVGKA